MFVGLFLNDKTVDTETNKMSLQDKIKTFNHVAQNEAELMEKQRRMAAFTAKLSKFSIEKEDRKKDSEALKKAKMFSDWEGKEQREKEAKIRKEEFLKTAGKFEEGEDIGDTNNNNNSKTEVTKKLSLFEEREKEEDDVEDEEDLERKRQEFVEKQKIFECQ